ncbi:MAG TPA: CBS domain-containing protein [Micromonosporaceae bacterium]
MSKAREVMHVGAECVGEEQTLTAAARKMRDLHVGALPICGTDDRLQGIITDRDIVVRCVAEGLDPDTVTAGELAMGAPIYVDANAETDEVLQVMTESKIRRVPVLDNQRLVGMISEADLATHLDEHQIKRFAESIYGSPPTT